MIELRSALFNLSGWYCLEHSQYSEDRKLFPFHIGFLIQAVERNQQDCFYNHREQNKWQIIFVGTQDECQSVMDEIIKRKTRSRDKAISDA